MRVGSVSGPNLGRTGTRLGFPYPAGKVYPGSKRA